MFEVELELHSSDTQGCYYSLLIRTTRWSAALFCPQQFLYPCPPSRADGATGDRSQRSMLLCLRNDHFYAVKCPVSFSCGPAPAVSFIYGMRY